MDSDPLRFVDECWRQLMQVSTTVTPSVKAEIEILVLKIQMNNLFYNKYFFHLNTKYQLPNLFILIFFVGEIRTEKIPWSLLFSNCDNNKNPNKEIWFLVLGTGWCNNRNKKYVNFNGERGTHEIYLVPHYL